MPSVFKNKEDEIARKQKEIDDKLANFKGGEEYKAQLDKLNQEKDALLRQVAELEPLKGYDEKYKEASEKLTSMQRQVAYSSIKPNFPDTVNQYEADAKWNEFKRGIEEKYNIELVDGKPIAVDKENVHKQFPLSELLKQDANISELLKGRQQRGTGANPANLVDVEGVPFKIPDNATNEEISKLAKEHLVKKLGSHLHKDFSKEMLEILTKIKKSA